MLRDRVIDEMEKVFEGFPRRISHTLNVLEYADQIMEGERVSTEQREFISIVVILHDIGVIEAERKHGSSAAPYQEEEGARVATEILERMGCGQIDNERVRFIVGNHHTSSKIDGLDFQILWEADLLENLKARDILDDEDELKRVIDENFTTPTGKNLAYRKYLSKSV